MNLFSVANLFLLLTGLVAIYLLYLFWGRYSKKKKLHDVYYLLGFGVSAGFRVAADLPGAGHP